MGRILLGKNVANTKEAKKLEGAHMPGSRPRGHQGKRPDQGGKKSRLSLGKTFVGGGRRS